jgi:hypothetical protein
MVPKRDINGNEIQQGDILTVVDEMDGLPPGASGRAVLYNPVETDKEILGKYGGRVVVVLDEPWAAIHGYMTDHWNGPRPLLEADRKTYMLYTRYCKITNPLSNEQYSPEELEEYE